MTTAALIVFGVSVAFAIGVIVYLSSQGRPAYWYRGIGIRVFGAEMPWPDLEAVIDAILDELAATFPKKLTKLSRFWIDVHPPGTLLRGIGLPHGTLRINDRMTEAAGTIGTWSIFGLRPQPVVVVRQDRSLNGKIISAKQSALVHEVVEHLVPWILSNHARANQEHSIEWKELSQRVYTRLRL